ncbi:MAG TPA: hypothetical protein PKD37_07060 [Oligoflexia bacterium]|nr:hypothetical protein [Oligoflexia bacterium]HMP27722.1 hypothetical protein [Oligoflexia bacterium]
MRQKTIIYRKEDISGLKKLAYLVLLAVVYFYGVNSSKRETLNDLGFQLATSCAYLSGAPLKIEKTIHVKGIDLNQGKITLATWVKRTIADILETAFPEILPDDQPTSALLVTLACHGGKNSAAKQIEDKNRQLGI